MRHAIISDIHGNLHALEAVLAELERESIGCYHCLGDVVGYGAYPNECTRLIRELGCQTVAGNHDYAVLGKILTDNFNKVAKVSTTWTQDTLDEAATEFLESLPLVHETGPITLVHGSLYAPELFDYVQSSYDASLSLERTPGKVCFIGHSHIPVTFVKDTYVTYTLNPEVRIPENGKALVNVGSVGQPRDQNPRASFAIYDDELDTVWTRRIPYDIEGAIEGIRNRGLPPILGDRLRFGTITRLRQGFGGQARARHPGPPLGGRADLSLPLVV